jgi:hypothetical protein
MVIDPWMRHYGCGSFENAIVRPRWEGRHRNPVARSADRADAPLAGYARGRPIGKGQVRNAPPALHGAWADHATKLSATGVIRPLQSRRNQAT